MDSTKLSGDLAHELFTSSLPFPLHDLLESWKSGELEASSGYVIAVIGAFNHMVECHEGKRDGTYRPNGARIIALNRARCIGE